MPYGVNSEAPQPSPDQSAFDHLSEIIAGNKNLITEPGLVQALSEGNATSQQAQALDQYVGGLKSELAVQAAAKAGTQIYLSDQQKQYLDGVGIDYSSVAYSPQTAESRLRQMMAKKGLQPRVGADGSILTDAEGNVFTEKLGSPSAGTAQAVNVSGKPAENPSATPSANGPDLGGGFSWNWDAKTPDPSSYDKELEASGAFGPGQHNVSGYHTFETAAKLMQEGSNSWTHALGDAIGGAASAVGGGLQDAWNFVDTNVSNAAHNLLNEGKNAGASIASGSSGTAAIAAQGGSQAGAQVNPQTDTQRVMQAQDELMRRLGYDPGSLLSRAAFESRGYDYGDTQHLQEKWDAENPHGLNGWDGKQAALEAEVYLADPNGYKNKIIADTSLTNDQIAAKLNFLGSKPFTDLVNGVSGEKRSIGVDFTRGVGIDPVKHPGAFQITSAVADTAASFLLDPTAIALSGYSAANHAAVALHDLADAGSIGRIMNAKGLRMPSVMKAQATGHEIVDLGAQMREAEAAHTAALAAGDAKKVSEAEVQIAQVQARVQQNRLGGLLPDIMGKDRIVPVRYVGADGKAFYKYETQAAKPIEDYDELVHYLQSKAALFRLQGGSAPVEFATMPGALNSRTYAKIKGAMSSAAAGRSVRSAQKGLAKVLTKAEADPAFAKTLITQKDLESALPTEDSSVNFLTGQVNAARDELKGAATPEAAAEARAKLNSAKRALSERQTQIETETRLDLIRNSDAVTGDIRQNRMRYGRAVAPKTALGKFVSIYTLGAAQRSARIITRVTNWSPTRHFIDITDGSAAEDIRRAARGFMSAGDSRMLAARYALGTADTRRAVIAGLYDQVEHAAGLSRTQAGRDLMDARKERTEVYNVVGNDYLDSSGRPAALYPGQVETKFDLPNFGKIHKASAKIGILEAIDGKIMQSKPVEALQSMWRLLILGTPVTANRAIAEAYLNAAAQGEGMVTDALAAKALLKKQGRLALPGLDRSHPLRWLAKRPGFRQIVSSAKRMGIPESRVARLIWRVASFEDVGNFYTKMLGRSLSDAEIEALKSMPPDLLEGRLLRQSQLHWAQEMDPGGFREATQIAEAGLTPTHMRFGTGNAFEHEMRHIQGYKLSEELDGRAGAEAFAFSLGSRINKAPHVAHAILDAIETKSGDVSAVVKALETGESRRLMHQSLYGKVYIDGAGRQMPAVTAEQIAKGKEQWAQRMVLDFKTLLEARNGSGIYKPLADYIREHDMAPDGDWIMDKVPAMFRPERVIAPNLVAKAPTKLLSKDFLEAIQDPAGRAYKWAVERLIQRNATGPLYAAAYMKSKVALEPWKARLIEQGMKPEIAETTVAQMASQQAWHRIGLMVDDPELKAQMDVVGRSFFAFSRATTSMIRRWGTTFYKNPAAFRRMQLAAEGATHSGMVYKDDNGDWMFAIPGTGITQEFLWNLVSKIPGLHGLAQFPVSDFRGRVASIIPGSDNPFQYNTAPMASISLDVVGNLFPNHQLLFDEINQKLNGSQAVGTSWIDTLTPRVLRQAIQNDVPMVGPPLGGEARSSVLTSAMVGALYNLEAAGLTPPEGASDVEMQKYLDRLKTQTRSVLFSRFAFGLVSPMTLSSPDDNGEFPADPEFARVGVQNLHDEYKQIIDDTGGNLDRANAIWTAMHPDMAIYEQSSSGSQVKDAYMPATKQAYEWMANNHDLIHKYGGLAAYFMPEDAGGFSMPAYRAQLEQGFREKYTPKEFIDAYRVKSAGATYYAAEDQKTAQYTKLEAAKAAAGARAKFAGAPIEAAEQPFQTQIDALNKNWSNWSTQFKDQHPAFKANLAGYASASGPAGVAYANLKQMVAENAIPADKSTKQAVAQMVEQWDNYQQFMDRYSGARDAESEHQKNWARSNIQNIIWSILKQHPDLADLYNGVIHPLDNQIPHYSPPTQGG